MTESLIAKSTFPFFYPTTTQILINCYKNDDLDTFILNFTSAGLDAFVIACQYNAVRIANYCIEQNFGINYIVPKLKTTAFTYTCYHNNYDLSNKIIQLNLGNKKFLLLQDKSRKTALKYIKGIEMNQIKLTVLNMINDSTDNEIDFKIFKREDFDFVNYDIYDTCGSYGEIFHIIDKETGTDMILKKYKACGDDHDVIDQTTTKEITLLKMINKINSNVAVKIYGFYFNNNCLYLVLEYFPYTLDDVFNFFKTFSDEDKRVHYKKILHNIIELVFSINSYGINHNDLKPNNIMMDNSGRFKFIDFGISEYFGISPSRQLSNESVMTTYIKPPENENFNGVTNQKFLNSDVFSIGCIFINEILKTSHVRYVFNGVNILKSIRLQNNTYSEFTIVANEIFFIFDPILMDFLKRMIHWNPKERPFAKECLKDEYFTSIPFTYTNNISLSNDEMQLIYIEEIHQSTLNFKFCDVSNTIISRNTILNERMYFILVGWLFEVFNVFNYKIDVILNVIPKVFNLFNDDIKRSEYQGYGAVKAIISDYQNNRFPFDLDRWVRICDRAYSEEKLSEFIFKSIQDKDTFSFVPVKTHLKYLKCKLIERMIPNDNLLIEKIINMLVYWVVYNRGIQYSIWKLIQHCYLLNNSITGLEDIFDIVDEELLEKLQIINSIEPKIKIRIRNYSLF